MTMADFGRNDPRFGDGDALDAIARSDALLDAIAGERRFRPGDPGEGELVALLEGWRNEVRGPATGPVISEQDALVALHKGMAAQPARSGGARRHLAVVASAAAAVLCLGGFGAVVATSNPGDSLYGLRTSLFGEKQVRDDQVALAAQAEMLQVQQLIAQGDWEQAQQKLQAVSTQVQSVDDVATKTDLVQQWNQLSVKVGTRDPQATLPPVPPGEPTPPPPPGVTLLEVPSPTETTETTTSSISDTTSTSPSDTTSTSPTSSDTTSPSDSATPSSSRAWPPSTATTARARSGR